jgi:rubredoxin
LAKARIAINTAVMYRCMICGYVYNEEEGDPLHDIDPGTPFEDIPDSWVCPICGVTKEHFEEV